MQLVIVQMWNEVLSLCQYLPPVESRSVSGFVGLKNGGATCYMNAVFQQLYMQPGLPEVHVSSVLFSFSIHQRATALWVQNQFHPVKLISVTVCVLFKAFLSIEDDTDQPEESVFYQVQSLFGHLMESKLQYYVPENFWKVTDRSAVWSDSNALTLSIASVNKMQNKNGFIWWTEKLTV